MSTATYPEQVPIDAYGNGGFRFAGMSHRGSLLLLPNGVFGWNVELADALSIDDFFPVFEIGASVEFLMLGTGVEQHFPSSTIRDAFAKRGVGLEVMDTGAACRAYNVLLAEQRAFAAAVIAVE